MTWANPIIVIQVVLDLRVGSKLAQLQQTFEKLLMTAPSWSCDPISVAW